MPTRKRTPISIRLQRRLAPPNENGCILWTGTIKKNSGYGEIIVHIRGKWRNQYAHRISFELAFGEIPAGKFVCHRCDVPLCCNPSHLFIGDQTSNMEDMREKGRSCFGEKNGQAKLSIGQVLEIRKRLSLGHRKVDIGRSFGVHPSTIYLIEQRKKWGSLK